MDAGMIATPFGRRPMTLGQLAEQKRVRDMPAGKVTDKWKIFHTIRAIRKPIGASDRALAILNALLTFHPHNVLSNDDSLIVWPSNEQLCARANGMPETTLRRHLAILVRCGLVLRRDSPNGKRYARKTRNGAITQAYGFDLSPLVARAEEFEMMAARLEIERQAFKSAREQLTLLRRDIVKLVELGLAEDHDGNWPDFQIRYRNIIDGVPRSPTFEAINAALTALLDLRAAINDALETLAESTDVDANDLQNGRHIQNSDTDNPIESETKDISSGPKHHAAKVNAADTNSAKTTPPLSIVLKACPDLIQYEQNGEIRGWRDFVRAAEKARTVLAINSNAWHEACFAMGLIPAAITLAAILQHAERISCPGAYLRSLTAKAKDGKFSTQPMIHALRNRQRHESISTAPVSPAAKNAHPGMFISAALRRSAQL
ncbi:replication initiation protein RepC [Martelella alba]|uniref:Replication initiation protein RepC n=1 Tax=Martelella alba TaxID=2590451 RepID=A0A506U244_9HYPH|nr:plasmid replication protein RepC [Martelella alba]TPW27341.1 replication initiation protein RepC [Martelella alba]